MGQEQPAQWYDQADKSISGLPLEDSPYQVLYKRAADFLPSRQEAEKRHLFILDVGCGTGRFAKELASRGYDSDMYAGVDFSKANIEMARDYSPSSTFFVFDVVREGLMFEGFALNFNIFILLEFLEHIKADRLVVELLPSASQVVFSVPSFDYESHVRFFRDLADVKNRYAGLLSFKRESIWFTPGGGQIFIFDSIRK